MENSVPLAPTSDALRNEIINTHEEDDESDTEDEKKIDDKLMLYTIGIIVLDKILLYSMLHTRWLIRCEGFV
jgi:hypothetical protein